MVDALGNRLAFFLTGGQAHDLQGADVLLPQMRAEYSARRQSVRRRLCASDRTLLARETPAIPPKSGRKTPRDFDREMYKARHLIENFVCKLKQFRAIATRYDKTARNFLAGIHLVASVILLN